MNEYVNPQNYEFCPVCGSHLIKKYLHEEAIERLVCSQCPFIFYINPIPAVAIILMKGKRVVLVRRKYEPRKGDWSLPAGFMEYHETSEQTAVREAKEETNLNIKVNELFGVFPGFEDPRVHVVLIVYWGEIVNGHLAPGDDAEEVKYFPLNALPENIAFSSHQQILEQLCREWC